MKNGKQLRRWDVTGKRELTCVSCTLPALAGDQVHLEFVSNGVCGSDTHMFHTGAVHPGHKGPHQALTLGHEIIGRVIAVGADVTSVKAGDMVAVEPGLPCGTCPDCRKGHYHCCPKTLYMGTPPQNGGLADELIWPAKWCHVLPEDLAADPVLASLVEPLAACQQAIELRDKIHKPEADEWTMVTGSGAMALGTIALIKAANPDQKVVLLARSQKDLDFAREKLGADAVFALSSIDAASISERVVNELSELLKTDHFDNDENIDAQVGQTKAGIAAAKAARERARELRERGAHEAEIKSEMTRAAVVALSKMTIEENKAVFLAASAMADGYICALIECTGNERLFETALDARFILGTGVIVGLGCHYGVSFDAALLRRREAAYQPVRRSCNKFPATIKLLQEKPELFKQLVGGTAKFASFGALMQGDVKAEPTGSGGPKTVIVRD